MNVIQIDKTSDKVADKVCRRRCNEICLSPGRAVAMMTLALLWLGCSGQVLLAQMGDLSIQLEHGYPVLRWQNTPGQVYAVQTCPELGSEPWETQVYLSTDGPTAVWNDESDRLKQCFYRVTLPDHLDLFRTLQTRLEAVRRNNTIEGVCMAVCIPGHPIWVGTGGISHVEEEPGRTNYMRPDMRFEYGSCTKNFTATLIMQLAEEGRLTLEDTIGMWLPGLNHTNVNPNITVRQLLRHRAGFTNVFFNDAWTEAMLGDLTREWTPEETLEYLEPPIFPPGANYLYAGSNYILLGMIAEAVTGQPVAVEFRRRFFDPYDLNSTYLPGVDELVGYRPYFYQFFPVQGYSPWNPDTHPRTSLLTSKWTSAGMVSTPFDGARWMFLLGSGALLNEASMAEMFDFRDEPGTSSRVGLGVFEWSWPMYQEDFQGHGGRGFGARSEFWYLRNSRVSLCAMWNRMGNGALFSIGLSPSIVGNFLKLVTAPESQTVGQGNNAVFSVSATSPNPVTYQWQFNGAGLDGATNATLFVRNVQPADEGDYTVVVTDGAGTFTPTTTLTVALLPTIAEHPQSQIATVGETVTFSVVVTNTATLPIGYRWRHGGRTLTSETLEEHTCSFTITNVQIDDAGNYTVVVTNPANPTPGYLSKAAVLEVLEAK